MAKRPPAEKQDTWLDRPLFSKFTLNWEIVIFGLILLVAVLTRFYDLGARTVSHDETSHVYFSWQLFRGNGYTHSPLTHGPFLFHLTALSYFLFGDGDFSARIPMALFSIATIAFLWSYRRYLTRLGAVIAAALFLISPYMLYYGRYARNEAFVGLFGLVMLWAILRYLDTGENRFLYFLTASVALHFTTKETSFIYVAQALIFLGLVFLGRINRRQWENWDYRRYFYPALLFGLALILLAVGYHLATSGMPADTLSATEISEPVVATEAASLGIATEFNALTLLLGGLGLLALLGGMFFLIRGYGWQRMRQERSFSMMVLLLTLVIPHLAAFPVKWLGYDPLNYTDTNNLIFVGIVVAILVAISATIGLAWNKREWLINMAIFYAIFVPFFTTMFTYADGFFSGLVGSLGYWLEQQGVQRGSQPGFYYFAIQIPLYEYLSAAGTLLAAGMGWKIWRRERLPREKQKAAPETHDLTAPESRRMALWLLAFWTVTSLVAYTLAGEKMPWLTYHIAIPMLMLSGWSFARLGRRIDWAALKTPQGALRLLLAAAFILAVLGAVGMLLGTNPPFRSPETADLKITYRFLVRVLIAVGSGIWLWSLSSRREARPGQMAAQFGLVAIFGLALLTAKTSFRAAFLDYDQATEYLVYAHMARGPKEVIEQIEDLSMRLNGTLDLAVAYDDETSYPYWWYLRNFPNARYYANQPGSDLRDVPVILVGDTNYGKIEPVVGQAYYEFEYVRIWWPNQDYFNFSRSSIMSYAADLQGNAVSDQNTGDYITYLFRRLAEYLGNPQIRQGIYDIWMHRDFNTFLTARGQSPLLSDWVPARTMRMYVRKDIVAQIWDFGVEPVEGAAVADPYEGMGIELAADRVFGFPGAEVGQLNTPRGLALAPDGSLYVADSNNHRIQHFDAQGNLINAWGSFGDASTSAGSQGGSFFEPWGVAVSPDGDFVYVADTWNHRVQKFTADGEFVTMWGVFGQGSDPYALWGPRDLVVDEDGNVLVVDTGNKLVKIYDADGNYLSQFGGFGLEAGFFDEPVGLAYDANLDRLYLADTWNQRVQVFNYADGQADFLAEWPIAGWYGQSLDNKPYLEVGPQGRVYITDPERGRVLVYEPDGTFVHFFGGYDQVSVNIGIALGIAGDADGIWISDSQNNQLLFFANP